MVPKAITGWQGKRWKALEGPGRPWNDLLPQDLQGSKAYKYSAPVRCRFCSVVESIVVNSIQYNVWPVESSQQAPHCRTITRPPSSICEYPYEPARGIQLAPHCCTLMNTELPTLLILSTNRPLRDPFYPLRTPFDPLHHLQTSYTLQYHRPK